MDGAFLPLDITPTHLVGDRVEAGFGLGLGLGLAINPTAHVVRMELG